MTRSLSSQKSNNADPTALSSKHQRFATVKPVNTEQTISYKRHRYAAAIISHCVWLYFRFSLSFRDVEVMMAERGVVVSYESIRTWCEKFGRQYARKIRLQRGRMGDIWHLDEVYLKIDGVWKYLWHAGDQEGQVLDILVQPKRNKEAAARFFKKVLRGAVYTPRQVVTDKLAAYIQPCADVLPNSMHTRDKGANNHAENSHQPTRQRERRMKRFKSAAHAQRFLSIFSEVGNLFALARHTVSAANHRLLLATSLNTWSSMAQAPAVQW